MSIFNSIPSPKNKRSKFNLSHTHKTAMGIGQLIPVLCREVIPGDIWNLNTASTVRMAPMVAPLMHNMDIRFESFFVPNRLIWKDWQDFITGGVDGNLAPVKPHFPSNTINGQPLANTIYDYLGLPLDHTGAANINVTATTKIDAMPMLALRLIYESYYKDQNLEEDYAPFFPVASGEIKPTDTVNFFLCNELKTRCWEKDYFTSALPWTQRGVQAMIPVSGTGDVRLKEDTGWQLWKGSENGDAAFKEAQNGDQVMVNKGQGDAQVNMDPNGTLESTFSGSNISINDLRRTSAVQRWLENNARGGSRYIEQILSHFGVISSDSRLQRPEFLRSSRAPIYISEILQTSGTDIQGQATPQGNMSGHGIGGGIADGGYRQFEEHGFIVQFASIVPRSAYIFGIEQQFTRFDKLEYAWPELARLGEEPVYKRELDANDPEGDEPFGYQPRYASYKNILSRTTGEMARTLSHWQMARRINGTNPVNSEQFVHIDQAEFYKNFAAGESSANQQVYVELGFNLTCSRLLPKYGTPILM